MRPPCHKSYKSNICQKFKIYDTGFVYIHICKFRLDSGREAPAEKKTL